MLTRTLAPLALLVALAAAATGPSLGQTSAPKPRPVPRTADGKPDLSGVWIAGGIALLFGEDEARRIAAADKAAGRPAPPPREPPPYKPEAEKRRQEYLARRGIDDPMARCLLTGVP